MNKNIKLTSALCIAAFTLIFAFGCDGLTSSDSVSFRSIYLNNDNITLNVTAEGTDKGENEIGACFYYTNLDYDGIITELEDTKKISGTGITLSIVLERAISKLARISALPGSNNNARS